jgi:hypothetical protein
MAHAGARSWTSHGAAAAVVGGSWDKVQLTAGERRWTTVTAVLDDAPSGLDRFSSPLYTVAETARYLDVPASTLTSWGKGYRRAGKGRPAVTGSPVLTTVTSAGRGPVIPFVGLGRRQPRAVARGGVRRQRPLVALP